MNQLYNSNYTVDNHDKIVGLYSEYKVDMSYYITLQILHMNYVSKETYM